MPVRVRRTRLVLLVVIILGLTAPSALLPFTPWFVGLFERIAHVQFWGPAVLEGSCVVSGVFPFPAVIPILASGFLLGVFRGSLIAVSGSTLGACVAFLIGRTVAHRWLAGRVGLGGRAAALDRAVGAQGFRIVLLSRLSPFAPFIPVNYAFSLTQVSFGQYTWGTLVGGAPGTILYVFFGAGLHSLREIMTHAGQNPTTATRQVLLYISLAVTLVVSVWLTWIARRALRQALPQEPPPEDQRTAPPSGAGRGLLRGGTGAEE
jgi:uncharacterized membrane protein YdjX (TVP38/TMEM64 family)